jgi:hypothetical protein
MTRLTKGNFTNRAASRLPCFMSNCCYIAEFSAALVEQFRQIRGKTRFRRLTSGSPRTFDAEENGIMFE